MRQAAIEIREAPRAAGPLRAEGRWLRDGQGRAVVLRGVNLSGRHKQPPFTVPATEEVLGPLRDWGLSVVRLVLVWEAIEPEPGRYDDAYLDRVAELAAAAGERGLHVIMDMHQDIYSRAFGGSGAPEWTIAAPDRRADLFPRPDPLWFMRYANWDEVRRSLSRFFRDEDGLQGHFVASMARAARRLARERAVIGCELYNEPFPGELNLDRFEAEHLGPFYRRALAAVREAAPDWLVFFEGTLMASEQGTALDLGGARNLVYFPHFYDKMAFALRRYDGDHSELDRVMAAYDRDAARMDLPWMLGEYGIPTAAEGAAAYLRDQERALERCGAGGTCWHYNPTPEDWNDEGMSVVGPGGQETPLVDALCRPYPQAVAGDVIGYGFDDERRRFELRFRPRAGETVVYLPRRHFGEDPSRVEVRLSAGDYGLDLRRQLLVLRAPPGDEPVTLEVASSSAR